MISTNHGHCLYSVFSSLFVVAPPLRPPFAVCITRRLGVTALIEQKRRANEWKQQMQTEQKTTSNRSNNKTSDPNNSDKFTRNKTIYQHASDRMRYTHTQTARLVKRTARSRAHMQTHRTLHTRAMHHFRNDEANAMQQKDKI